MSKGGVEGVPDPGGTAEAQLGGFGGPGGELIAGASDAAQDGIERDFGLGAFGAATGAGC